MKEWLAKVESRNVPHIARGAAFGLGFWVLGIWLGWFSPVLFSFIMMFAASFAWEIRDQIRMVKHGEAVSDGFSWMDILCDMAGVGIGQLWHLSTHAFDG